MNCETSETGVGVRDQKPETSRKLAERSGQLAAMKTRNEELSPRHQLI